MPLLRISVQDGRPVPHDADMSLQTALLRALGQTDGPVVIMVHGYKYAPGSARFCPHRSLFSPTPTIIKPRSTSWPRRLGLGPARRDPGLVIGFGWPARGTIWQAHARAAEAGRALAALLRLVQALSPGREVHLIAHSLGARVVACALTHAPAGSVSRAILMAGAVFESALCAALTSPAGRGATVLNVTSRENDLFDFLLERLVRAPGPCDRMIGAGRLRLPNLVTLQLDDPSSLTALRQAGFPIAAPCARICHWSPYLRPGAFPLYRAFLRGDLELSRLQALLPDTPAPRWSRLMPLRTNAVRPESQGPDNGSGLDHWALFRIPRLWSGRGSADA